MVDFVWVITSDKQSALGQGGVSASYIVPQQQMNSNEKKLRGSRVWMVLRGQEDRCLGVITTKRIERFSEGYHTGDFLITCDLNASMRLSAGFETAKPYAITDTQKLSIGINRISDDIADKLKALISNTVQVKLAAPSDAFLATVKFDSMPKKGVGIAKMALSQIIQKYALDQIWASGTGAKLGPFGNFAARLLSIHGQESAVEIVNFLKDNDPLRILLQQAAPTGTGNEHNNSSVSQKVVDLDFTEIDPATIYAREFVASDTGLPDLESALNKTEAAEQLHQAMLRDISTYLKGKAFSPYESGSVDLMINYHERTKIYEIKSSNIMNVIAQAAKGAFQIACYVNAMKVDYNPLDAALIMHKIDDENLEKFTHEALKQLGIRYLVYNPAHEWPDRVKGLLD